MWTSQGYRKIHKSFSVGKLQVHCQKRSRAAIYTRHRPQPLHVALLLLFLFPGALLVVASSVLRHSRNFFGFCEDAGKDLAPFFLYLNPSGPYRNLSEENPLLWHVRWGREDDYRMGKKLGSGSYGKVYLSRHLPTNSSVAIKVLTPPVKGYEVLREMKAMLDLRHPNIIQFRDAFIEHSSKSVCLVLEALEDAETLETFRMPPKDIQHYVKSMLSALTLAERKRWMHRDIGPENVMVSQVSKHLTVIDWGLAGMVREDGQRPFVGNAHYTAPELFLEVEKYNGAVDVWSVGVLFAEWLLCYPVGKNLFNDDGSSSMNVLISQGKILGSRALFEYLEEDELFMPPWAVLELGESDRQSWQSLRNEKCDVSPSETAYDLLDNLLAFDPAKRFSASQALKHQYFKT